MTRLRKTGQRADCQEKIAAVPFAGSAKVLLAFFFASMSTFGQGSCYACLGL